MSLWETSNLNYSFIVWWWEVDTSCNVTAAFWCAHRLAGIRTWTRGVALGRLDHLWLSYLPKERPIYKWKLSKHPLACSRAQVVTFWTRCNVPAWYVAIVTLQWPVPKFKIIGSCSSSSIQLLRLSTASRKRTASRQYGIIVEFSEWTCGTWPTVFRVRVMSRSAVLVAVLVITSPCVFWVVLRHLPSNHTCSVCRRWRMFSVEKGKATRGVFFLIFLF